MTNDEASLKSPPINLDPNGGASGVREALEAMKPFARVLDETVPEKDAKPTVGDYRRVRDAYERLRPYGDVGPHTEIGLGAMATARRLAARMGAVFVPFDNEALTPTGPARSEGREAFAAGWKARAWRNVPMQPTDEQTAWDAYSKGLDTVDTLPPEPDCSSGEVAAILLEALNAIVDRGPERAFKWAGMTAKDIALHAIHEAAALSQPVSGVE